MNGVIGGLSNCCRCVVDPSTARLECLPVSRSHSGSGWYLYGQRYCWHSANASKSGCPVKPIRLHLTGKGVHLLVAIAAEVRTTGVSVWVLQSNVGYISTMTGARGEFSSTYPVDGSERSLTARFSETENANPISTNHSWNDFTWEPVGECVLGGVF